MKKYKITGKTYANGAIIQKIVAAACPELAVVIFN